MVAPDPRLEVLLDRVRAQGGRITAARRAVLGVLLATHPEHLTVEELAGRVRAGHPDVHLSTVYRTLDAMEEAGLLTHVHLGHTPSTYHLADVPHHHAVCDGCGAVIHLPADLFDDLARRLSADHGYTLGAHHFALAGRCADCR